jgi:hypothetical protein
MIKKKYLVKRRDPLWYKWTLKEEETKFYFFRSAKKFVCRGLFSDFHAEYRIVNLQANKVVFEFTIKCVCDFI